MDDPEIAPKNDDEWMELWRQSFDDLAPLCKDKKDARDFYGQRTEIERAYFKGDDVSMFLRPRHKEKDPDLPTRFQFRYCNGSFAVATRVITNNKIDAIYQQLDEDNQRNDYVSMSNEIAKRIDAIDTPKSGRDLIHGLENLLADYKQQKNANKQRDVEEWIKKSKEKTEALEKEEMRQLHTDADQDAQGEEGGGGGDSDGDEKEEEEEEEGEKEEKAETLEETHFENVRDVKLSDGDRGGKKDNDDKEKKSRSCHIFIKKTVNLTWADRCSNAYTIPLDEVSLTNPDPHPDYAPFKDVDKESGQEITRFNWITDSFITAALFVMNTTTGSHVSSNIWRETKIRIRIPCAFDGTDKELLVVDHERARIISMPLAKETGEEYKIPALQNGKTSFKPLHCSLSSSFIAVAGYRQGENAPTVLVINRRFHCVTFINTDIPVSSMVLSNMQPSTLLMGFVDGTIIRHDLNLAVTQTPTGIPGITGGTFSKINHVDIYPPTLEGTGDDVLQACTERSDETAYTDAANIQLLRKKDCVLHTGYTKPVTRILERGHRILASSPAGLHLFRLFDWEVEERRVTMGLLHNASFDFRGNLLLLHKNNNSVELVQLHECHLNVTLNPPSGLNPPPPEMSIECSTVVMHDNAITVFHGDGTRRVMELKTYDEIINRSKLLISGDNDIDNEERRTKSFLTKLLPSSTKGGKKKTKNVKVNNKKKKK